MRMTAIHKRHSSHSSKAGSSRSIRFAAAALLLAGVLGVSLAGCSGAPSIDGTYIKVAETSGISSAWIVKGDSIQYVNGSCSQYNLDHEPAVLSEDLTRITDPATGDNYALTWYDDRSGFVWEDHGDFIRDDSEIGKSAVERWEANCGLDWLG